MARDRGQPGGALMFGTYCRLGVPVWAADRIVLRAACGLMSPDARRDPGLRAVRHHFYRTMLEFHHGQQELCREFGL